VTALNGISLEFRACEFVSVLGPSGCGKTTLLNIIGGLDQYTSGDLIIKDTSTKRFKDSDWDSYRNHSVGFVFQSYNLIPHQTVLQNVELALTLSGVSKAERRRRAIEVLERVGLADQLGKKPNQMSGGQMQRVAIARALINDPEILLADEPTGALDTVTSVQVMELLKEIASDRLVIMVTHNPDWPTNTPPASCGSWTARSRATPTPTPRRTRRQGKPSCRIKSPPCPFSLPSVCHYKPDDEKDAHHPDRLCRKHRHYRYRADPFAVQRPSELHRPGGAGHAVLLPIMIEDQRWI
jgi:ABC-type lipoprotein export system ATPase subunit